MINKRKADRSSETKRQSGNGNGKPSDDSRIIRHMWLICGLFLALFCVMAVGALFLIPGDTISGLQGYVKHSGATEGTLQGDRETDFMKLVLPILVVAIGFSFGLLGLKRLELYDMEIDRLRDWQAKQMHYEHDATENRLEEIQQGLETVAERFTEEALAKREEKLTARLAQFEASTDAYISRVENELKPYEWLKERKGELDYLVGVSSIGVAHKRVTEFFRDDKIDLAMKVADYAIERKLPGSPDDFHNLGSELAGRDLEPLAAQVVGNGLCLFPTNVDLLAGSVKYNSSMGSMEVAKKSYDEIKSLDHSSWNWRAFVFVGDYLEQIGRINEAMDLYAVFREELPDDERGYSQPGIYYMKTGRYTKAIEILEEGLARCRRCEQSALSLARIYGEIGEYEQAIHAANRGLEATAEDQPSANQAAILWHRAAAQDKLIHRTVADRLAKDANWHVDEGILALAGSCVADYAMCLSSEDVIVVHRRRGPDRLMILRSLLKKHGASQEQLSDIFPDYLGKDGIPPGMAETLAGMFQKDIGEMKKRADLDKED